MGKRTQRRKSSSLSPVPVIGLLLASGAAAGILYNILSPRGIFRPAPAVSVQPAESQADSVARPATPAPSGGEKGGESAPGAGAAAHESLPAVELLDLAAMKEASAQGSAIIVDARSPQSYEFGHIPGALSLPASDFEAAYAAQSGLLPQNVRIVVYCTSANCDESHRVLTALAAKGHRRLLHYKNGWNEWEIAEMPVEKGSSRVPRK